MVTQLPKMIKLADFPIRRSNSNDKKFVNIFKKESKDDLIINDLFLMGKIRRRNIKWNN